jgi:hypothetical protein
MMTTVTIDLPPEHFGDDATAQRVRPLRMRTVRDIGKLQEEASISALDQIARTLADVFPAWHVADPATGDPLPDPADAPDVMLELEPAAFQWLAGQGLAVRPTRRR